MASSKSPATATPASPEPALTNMAKNDARFWLREIFTLAIGLLSVAGIIIIMLVFEDKPIPNWPAKITINSLVSTLATVMKLALAFCVVQCFDELKWRLSTKVGDEAELQAFDTAAQGPWGAVLLLVKRYGKLASLGAIIVLLSVAVDPFIQQTVQPQDCSLTLTGDGVGIARTNYYRAQPVQLPAQTEVFDDGLSRAIYSGFINPPDNATSNIRFSCPTGNCTFGGADGSLAYASLALCAYVDDLSDQITRGVDENNETTWSIPIDVDNSANITVDGRFTMLASATSGQSDNLNPTFKVLMASAAQEPPAIFAFAGSFYPCVQQYTRSSTLNGTLQEATSGRPVPLKYVSLGGYGDYFSLAGDYPSSTSVDCTGLAKPQGSKTAAATPVADGGYIFPDPDIPTTADADILYFDPACTYMLDGNAFGTLKTASTNFFGPNLTVQANGASTALWLVDLYMSAPPSAWNVSTVTAWLAGVTNSVTAYWRLNPADKQHAGPNAYAPGTMFRSTTCVRIVWPWITLPAAAVCLTLILLLGTIVAIRLAGKGRAPRTVDTEERWDDFKEGVHGEVTTIGKEAVVESLSAGDGIVKATEVVIKDVLK